MKKTLLFLLIFSLISCSYKPILDENYKYQTTSQKEIKQDIKDCEERADNHLKGLKAERAAKEGVRRGAIGAFFGGIFSFIFGGSTSSLIKGIGIGAGVGAASGVVLTAGEGKITPDKFKQRYVSNCLAKKGYQVLGFQ